MKGKLDKTRIFLLAAGMRNHLFVRVACGLLALTSCTPNARESDFQSDAALRQLLDVQCLTGTFTLPVGEDWWMLTVRCFQDGKFISHGNLISGSVGQLQNRTLKPQFLWSNDNRARGESLSVGGTGGRGAVEPFWTNAMAGTYSLQPGAPVQVDPDGYDVLGFAQSVAMRDGKKDSLVHVSDSLKQALEDKKYVGALVLRTFKSAGEQEQFRKQLIQRDQLK